MNSMLLAFAALDARLALECRLLSLRRHERAVRIGVHDFERGAPQRLWFDVDLCVRLVHAEAARDDIRDTLDYDFVREVIAQAVGQQHHELQETLCDAVLAAVLLLAYAILVERHWVPVLVVITASGAALITLLPVWSTTAPPPVVFAEHFVTVAQLFAVRWAVAPSIPGWQDSYPFQLGFAVLGYSALALWGWAVVTRRTLAALQVRLLAFAFIGSLLLVFLALSWSAPLWQISGAERLLTYPWQVLLLAAPLLAAAAGSLPVLLPDLAGPAYWTVLVTLTVLASYPYLAPTYTTVQPPSEPVALLGTNQLAVLAADLTEADGRATLDVTWQVLQPLASDDNVFFQAIAGEGSSEQVVAQLDTQPAGADRPPTTWQPGEIFTQRYALNITGAPPNSPRQYYFGFYDWRSGERLLVDGGIDDKLVLHAD